MHKVSLQRQTVLVRWIPPPEGLVKLNVDGNCNKLNVISVGGAIRNAQGDWIAGFSCKLGAGPALLAKVWVVFLGLCLASHYGVRKIIVELKSSSTRETIAGIQCSVPSLYESASGR